MSDPYSRIYCIPEAALADSSRMRFRLATFVDELAIDNHLAAEIERECGVRVPRLGGGRNWREFYQQSELRDVLDSITHVYRVLYVRQRTGYSNSDAAGWKAFVSRVLSEEHTAYEADQDCTVRYAVDQQYVVTRKSALAGLDAEKWSAPRAEFERAYAALDRDVKDTNGAIRAIAAAVESCAKVFVGNGMSRLGPPEVQRFLRPKVEAAYSTDRVAIDASSLMLKALCEWINASHQYRHGQDASSEVSAPLDLAVQFLTAGAGFLRWLVDLDQRLSAGREM